MYFILWHLYNANVSHHHVIWLEFFIVVVVISMFVLHKDTFLLITIFNVNEMEEQELHRIIMKIAMA